MHDFGGMPAVIAALVVLLIGALLGLFTAFALGAATWCKQRWSSSAPVTLLLIIPAIWALTEWLMSWIFTGVPWITTGYAHTASPLAGFAPVAGVFGVTWLAAVIAASLVLLVLRQMQKLALGLIILLLAAGAGLQSVHWTAPHGAPISVRLLQGNVPLNTKFEADHIHASLQLYHDMIKAAPADLIATPETALPVLSQQLPPDYLPLLADIARQSDSHLLIGLPFNPQPMTYANSVIGIAPSGTTATPIHYRYDKHHLVPFGEFIPHGFHWFIDMMHIPLGDFSRGAAVQAPFGVRDQWVLPNICYEDLFGNEIAAQLAAGREAGGHEATILINVSNIAWFGDSLALSQHLQISQMRAIETGRPMLRATNTGTTAVIDPQGRVLARLAPYTKDVISATVQGYAGTTPYIVWGNKLIVALALLMLIIAGLMRLKAHKHA